MPVAKVTGNLIGNNLREARLKKGLDQVELAAILEEDYDLTFTQRTVSDIETQKRSVRDKELDAIAKALGVSPNELLGWNDR
jgi:transcriptional regulator with XRE-family HTH domain